PGAPPPGGPPPAPLGPPRPVVLAPDPGAAGPLALAAAMGAPIQRWGGAWPPPAPGTVWLLWWADADPKAPLPLPENNVPRADMPLIVLPPGAVDAQGWRPLAKARISVIDPRATLWAWDGPAAHAGPQALALAAAEAVARHFGLPLRPTPSPEPLPPGLAGATGAATDPAAADPRLRRGAPRAVDPDVAVRLAAAAQAPSAALAADPEPLVRARAARLLDDDSVLEGLLRDPSSVVRVVAAQRLTERAGRSPAARAALRGAAANPDAYVRWKAATGMAGDREALDLLIGLLADADIDVRREAAAALGRPPADPAGQARALGALLGAAADPNSFVRRRVAEALGGHRDPRAFAALQQLAADPTSLVAEAASMAGARLGLGLPRPTPYAPPARPTDAASAAAALATADATRQKDLCGQIAGEAWARPLLLPLLSSSDSEVRKAAVDALGRDPEAGAALHGALADLDPDVRITALVGIAAQPPTDADALLAALRGPLAAPDAEERLRAAEALAAAARAPASPAVEAALAALAVDPDERTRAAAVGARPGLLAPGEAAVVVLRAAAAAGGAPPAGQSLVDAARPGADPALAAWAHQVIQVEDDLLHVVFSWTTAESRPLSHRVLRPLAPRPYGQPNRG
ncbi:MAG: hypothetical protein RL071_4381, partial [Pseudomonadota bacterium]